MPPPPAHLRQAQPRHGYPQPIPQAYSNSSCPCAIRNAWPASPGAQKPHLPPRGLDPTCCGVAAHAAASACLPSASRMALSLARHSSSR